MYVWHGNKTQLLYLLTSLGSLMSGKTMDRYNLGHGFRVTIGYTLLSDVFEGFVQKARGGTDAMHIKWPPLSPKTIANRRVGPSDLEDPMIKERQKVFDAERKRLLAKYMVSMDKETAYKTAARMAQIQATKTTGRTKVQTLGHRNVEILRDTGALGNSLMPGVLNNQNPVTVEMKPIGVDGNQYQIFEIGKDEIVIGSSRPYCAVHQHGSKNGRIPRRQFLPDDVTGIPQNWVDNMTYSAVGFMSEAVGFLINLGPEALVGLDG